MKPRRTVSGYILLIGLLTLSIVGGVVIYQIYSAVTKSQVTNKQEIQIKSIDGSLDLKIFDNLSSRESFSTVELETPISTPTLPVATPTPSVTRGLILNASGSGDLLVQ